MNALLARWRATGLRARTLLLLGISTTFLLGMAGCEHLKRISGDEIILRTRPVDPREILRGNYVALDYEIERVHLPDLLTPADPYSLLFMAVPLTLLYFGGILLAKFLPHHTPAMAMAKR